ncbi:MAG: diguanylate cyclase [Bulleidia sp.]|nr:diguanylate cyclase [Bulleidia sp.]
MIEELLMDDRIRLGHVISPQRWKLMLQKNKEGIQKMNLDLVFLISCVFAVVAACMFVTTFVIHDTHLTGVWVALLATTLILMRVSSRSGNSSRASFILILVFLSLLFGGSLYIVYCAKPQANFISLIALLVLIPSMFILNPKVIILLSTVMTAVCFIINTAMPHPLLPMQELNINYVICGIGGAIFGIYTGYMKLLALDNARRMKEMARMDASLDILNHNSFFDDYASAQSQKQLRGVFMIDLNRFKQVNDNYGHQTGDECLKTMVQILNEAGSHYPVAFYRYGGDEFIGTLSKDSRISSAEDVQAYISRKLAETPVKTADGKEIFITASIGFSEFHNVTENSLEQCIREADNAMYRMKEAMHKEK